MEGKVGIFNNNRTYYEYHYIHFQCWVAFTIFVILAVLDIQNSCQISQKPPIVKTLIVDTKSTSKKRIGVFPKRNGIRGIQLIPGI